MTKAQLEELNMQLLEGDPSEKELWTIAIDLFAEVRRLRNGLEEISKAHATTVFEDYLASVARSTLGD